MKNNLLTSDKKISSSSDVGRSSTVVVVGVVESIWVGYYLVSKILP